MSTQTKCDRCRSEIDNPPTSEMAEAVTLTMRVVGGLAAINRYDLCIRCWQIISQGIVGYAVPATR